MKLASRADVRRLMGSTPIYRNDREVLSLQAADLYAWWIRKWAIEGVQDGIENLRFAWHANKAMPRLHMRFSEKDFLTEFTKAYDPEVIARSVLDHADVVDALRELSS